MSLEGEARIEPARDLDLEVRRVESGRGNLVDAIDVLLDKGAAVQGDLVLGIADVDLIRLNLKLLLSSVETLEQSERRKLLPPSPGRMSLATAGPPAVALEEAIQAAAAAVSPAAPPPPWPERSAGADLEPPAPDAEPAVASAPPPAAPAIERSPGSKLSLDPKAAEKGVARLVLTLVEFIRRLLERQAIRRMDGGLLDEASVERMGDALARLEAKVQEMQRAFGLEGEELDLDLGPLGRLNGPAERDAS